MTQEEFLRLDITMLLRHIKETHETWNSMITAGNCYATNGLFRIFKSLKEDLIKRGVTEEEIKKHLDE
jgi:hypothetical protein